jgi:hypothetical protein
LGDLLDELKLQLGTQLIAETFESVNRFTYVRLGRAGVDRTYTESNTPFQHCKTYHGKRIHIHIFHKLSVDSIYLC